jgi:poly(3-hydroxybutyrate) depolymerase
VTQLATSYAPAWFRANVIHTVPHGMPGAGRPVYPGFLQLMGFMSLDPDRHMEKHRNLFFDRLHGNHDAADKTAEFYDEYLSVIDLDAEIYIDSIARVFQKRELVRGKGTWRGKPVDTACVTDMGLQTIEGGQDDICAPGQTQAAHDILSGVPHHRRDHHVEPDVGHYGGFAGRRFKANILPRIVAFATENGS